MNRIEEKFQNLKKENKKALIAYVSCGDGGYETTEAAVLEILNSGADIVEIGIPFSDPIAEGSVIQAASHRALTAGTTLSGAFELAARLRKKTDAPLIFMLYINSIFAYGTDKFFEKCAESGIDGVIVPDLPYEERYEIKYAADKNNVISISLITPTSKNRIEKIAKYAKGFIYCVSSTGVTGMRSSFDTDFDSFISDIKKYTDIPCAIGFGISGPEQAAEIKKYCDGIIVGSAIVNIIGKSGLDSVPEASRFTASLRQAIDN